jgi:O-antigen ligase
MLLGQRIMNIVIYAFVFTAILEIILGWFQFLSGGPLNSLFENTQRFLESNPNPSIFYRFGFFRAIGTFIHPNTLSTYISLILPFLLIQIIHKKTRNNFLFVTAAFLAITAPIVTMTRWGFVSLGVTLLTFAILIKRPLKFKINLNRSQYMKLFGLSILTIAIFITTTQRLQTSTTNDLSLLTRIELTKQAVYTIQNNPLFGVGGGGFIKYFQQNDITNNSISRIFLAPVHSMPLLIASEHGIISLALLLSSLVYLSLYINNQSKKHELSLIKIACITSLIIFALNSLVSMRYFGDRISILFFTILGLTVNILDQNFKKDLN